MSQTEEVAEHRRERSPSFPFIPLERAIERARVMAEAHRRNAARLAVVGETWGYAPKSSGLLQTASALKAFGLVEDIGKGEDRRLQLTDLAWRILHDERPGAREQAIKEAALIPKLIAEYAPLWLPDRPSDNHCISELHLDRGFTQPSAELFLRVFDETTAFANLRKDDSVAPNSAEVAVAEPVQAGFQTLVRGQETRPAKVPAVSAEGGRLPQTMTATVLVRAGVSESSLSIKDDRVELLAVLFDQVGIQKIIDRLTAIKALMPEKVQSNEPRPDDEAAN